MCVPISFETVRQFMPAAATMPDLILQMYIDAASAADACLVGTGKSQAALQLIKLNYIAHQITLASGVSGEVVSERSPTGAALQYAAPATQGRGLAATSYGRSVLQLDSSGCFSALEAPRTVAYSV